jgi:hypothetical protein
MCAVSTAPTVALARDLLKRYEVPYREIDIDADPEMAERVKTWTHHLSVPTIVVAEPGADVPFTDFLPRPTGPVDQRVRPWAHDYRAE